MLPYLLPAAPLAHLECFRATHILKVTTCASVSLHSSSFRRLARASSEWGRGREVGVGAGRG